MREIEFVYSPEHGEWEDKGERERRQRKGLIRMAIIAATPVAVGVLAILINGK